MQHVRRSDAHREDNQVGLCHVALRIGDTLEELRAAKAHPVCPRCGGPRRILGAVTEAHAMRRLLAALGLAAESPLGRPGSTA